MENRTYTKRALITLLIPLTIVAINVIVLAITAILLRLTGIGRFTSIWMPIFILSFFIGPYVALVCSIKGIIFEIKALKAKEPKPWVIVMMIASIAILTYGVVFVCAEIEWLIEWFCYYLF